MNLTFNGLLFKMAIDLADGVSEAGGAVDKVNRRRHVAEDRDSVFDANLGGPSDRGRFRRRLRAGASRFSEDLDR